MRKCYFANVILMALALVGKINAQESVNYYLYLANGQVLGYPKEYVSQMTNDETGCTLLLNNDSVLVWSSEELDSVSDYAPEYPQFTAFRLDDKLNDQLFRDVDAVVNSTHVSASVSGIGKYLTPLFAMNRPDAVAYVDGVQQVSGQSRLRFAQEVVYTLGSPLYKRLSVEKISDEVWSEPVMGVEEIVLTEDMLSTNAPTSFSDESLGMMIDGNTSTMFHSTWSQDPEYEVDLSKQVYVAIALEKPISDLKFYFLGRPSSKYNVLEWRVEASNDGTEWAEIITIDEESGLPVDNVPIEYTSEVISLGGSYRYLRFVAARVGYKNYLCINEFRLYEVVGEEEEPELIQPARYGYQMVPMGREVPVRIDWLTDYATSVPRIDIDIDGGEMVSSKDYYLNAHITIQGNGVWDDYDFQDSVQIKGRGNSSWSSSPTAKNPYRLKFSNTVKPFGMKKGKNWNLIAQKQSGSLMTNPVAMKLARMVDAAAANDVIPVDLYMNGMYRGSYIFTQKVGMANNSVDFDDESRAALFELDTYSEPGKFYSDYFSLPVNIKDPEFDEDETMLDYDGVREEFNRFDAAVYGNANFERFVDMEKLTRYMLVNELVLNTELGHPKSSFLSRENVLHMSSLYTFGPVWDFDWSYNYESNRSYCTGGATNDFFSYHVGSSGNRFFSALWRSSEWVQYHYYKLWKNFVDNHLQELIDFVDDYYAYARSSFEKNSEKWGDGSSYDDDVANMKAWLYERAHYIKENLVAYGDDANEPYSYGDVNGDGVISELDIDYMLASLLGETRDGWMSTQADVDVDGNVTISDLVWLSQLLNSENVKQARSRLRTDLWAEDMEEEESYDFDIDDMPTLTPSDEVQHASVLSRTSSESSPLFIQTLTKEDGLLDNLFFLSEGISQYHYTSPLISMSEPIECLRLMVTETSSLDVDKSGFPCFALAEFYLYDVYGNPIELSESSFVTNAQEVSEGPMRNIVDGNLNTYFHSTWKDAVNDYHYIDVIFPEPMDLFSFGYVSRYHKIAPATIGLYAVSDIEIPSEPEEEHKVGGIQLMANTSPNGCSIDVAFANQDSYIAYMMDFVLPEGFEPMDGNGAISLSPRTESTHMMEGRMLESGVYRVVGYSETNASIADTTGSLFTLTLTTSSNVLPNHYSLTVDNVCFVTENAYEQLFNGVTTDFYYEEHEMKPQEIPSFEFNEKYYGDASFELPQYTDCGLPISYSSSNESVAILRDYTLHIIGAGSADITAVQNGTDEYAAAAPVTRTLTVNKASLKITADDIVYERGTTFPSYTLTYDGFVGGDNEYDLDELPRIECEGGKDSSVGNYPIHLLGGTDNNYEYTLIDGVLTVVEASDIDEPVFNQSKTFDIYDIRGRLVRKNAISFEGLQRGVYIINNRKVVWE